MQGCWQISGNNYFPDEKSSQMDLLPMGIYHIKSHPMKGLYLSRTEDSFEFNHKVYGVEQDFINRVVKSYSVITDNMGVLLNGIKGTGKSVTAKLICNKVKEFLPIIIVDRQYDGLPQFIAEIQQQIVVFIDEFEKVYQDYSSDVLTIMDGVYKTAHKRLFLLTTNNLYINTNLLQRPGRIRYVKTFDDLELSALNDIMDDMLIYPEFRNDCIEVISTLEIITIDLVKAVINEVNIHNESPKNFIDVFNVKGRDGDIDDKTYLNIVEMVKDDNVIPLQINNCYIYGFYKRLDEGYHIGVDYEPQYITVVEKYSKDTFKIELTYLECIEEEFKKLTNTENIIKLDDGKYLVPTSYNNSNAIIVHRIVKITEKQNTHYSFKKMVI